MAGQTLGIGNLDPTQDQLSPGGKRMRVVPDADPHRQPFRIRMARCAAFLALSIPTVATGTPGGTCTVASSASNPFSGPTANRSEEHTSELQSPCNLVCRLLLEKKKKITHINRE